MVAPAAVYYCTRAAGGGGWLALAGSAVVPAVTVLAGIIGRRRTDAMGIMILAALPPAQLSRSSPTAPGVTSETGTDC